MVVRRMGHGILLCLAGGVAAGCGGSPTGPEGPVPNFIRLESDAGDFVGAGLNHNYSQANAIITVTATAGHLDVEVQGDEHWWGTIQAPSGENGLLTGTHTQLQRYPFHDPAQGGLSWYGEGRGCNTLLGSYTIDNVSYSGGALNAIDLHFEQHCEGVASALRGTIHWRAGDTTRPPGPVLPIPASLWQPGAGTTPATGTYLFLTSEGGDYIGAGGAYTYTPGNSTIAVSGDGGHVSVKINGFEWTGDFQGMLGLDRLESGYYSALHRYPFHNPARGGLNWSGQGRGCNTLTGWFAVDQITHTNGVLTALELRFEQHCDGSTPALRGKLHWTG